jgi:hypothetical protein
MEDAVRILEAALNLPEAQRASVAGSLLESLEPPDAGMTRQEWLAEIERRTRAALEGRPGVLWEEARIEINQRLGCE